ncbi:L-serine dehydratase [Haloferula helveola]|uniref:L-serine ammonia-lyase n=1 Tax=Haloferula helveola TaxID=490095 RepID=A0ABM7R6S1_9BACT|nr:L-serine dehydratase [Haloferula helveola]
MSLPPSIFNDVLGPVMRGPSSSHSAAANRIGRLARDLLGEPLRKVIVRYDPNGSLVTTHRDQGTDLGLYSGLLGWPPEDERLPTYPEALDAAGIEVDVRYESFDAPHPNFYRLELIGESGRVDHLDAISTGGGMIELVAIDRIPLAGAGDLDLTLLWLAGEPEAAAWESHPASREAEKVEWHSGPDGGLLVLRSRDDLPDIDGLAEALGASRVRVLKAVLPILSRKNLEVPFETCAAMRAIDGFSGGDIASFAIRYEAARGGVDESEAVDRMRLISEVMRNAVKTGLSGTEYADRILPSQSPGFTKAEEEGRLVPADVNNRIIRYVSAIMEVKSSMGVIVAAPTAGSCGAMPGAVLAVADAVGADEEKVLRALFIAGLIGVFIARDATFAAEEGGCMAECGSGSAMAAAAMVYLAGGDSETSIAAASLALQNSLGMICDPVANRVEAPCLGRNVMAATNALACANMALAGYQHLVPLDEVILAMNSVAHAMPREHCCTALGGLSVSPTSKRIAGELASGGCKGCGKAAPAVEPMASASAE